MPTWKYWHSGIALLPLSWGFLARAAWQDHLRRCCWQHARTPPPSAWGSDGRNLEPSVNRHYNYLPLCYPIHNDPPKEISGLPSAWCGVLCSAVSSSSPGSPGSKHAECRNVAPNQSGLSLWTEGWPHISGCCWETPKHCQLDIERLRKGMSWVLAAGAHPRSNMSPYKQKKAGRIPDSRFTYFFMYIIALFNMNTWHCMLYGEV